MTDHEAGESWEFLFHLPAFFQSLELGTPHKCMCVRSQRNIKVSFYVHFTHPLPKSQANGNTWKKCQDRVVPDLLP